MFKLDTTHTTYLIGISDEGYVGHAYYGRRLKGFGGKYRLRMEEQERINGSLRSQLEIERYQRQFLAISLASEDTDRSLADIRQRLDDLRKDGKISESEIRQVDAVIRKHTARRDDWNRFRELFDKTHPLFLKT